MIIKKMVKKGTSTKTPMAAVNVNVNVEEPVVVETTTPILPDPPKKKRTRKVVIPDPEPVVVVEPEVIAEPESDVVEDLNAEVIAVEADNQNVVAATEEKKKRRLVSKETFVQSAEELQKELLPLLEDNKKLTKSFKVFMNDAYRLLRIKTHQKKQKDATNSGFMRPVKPSETLERFLALVGEDLQQPLTRAHLTTVICKYIKDHDLQNPKDRRIIFPDDEFKKLFQITENDTEPLTYYNIQKRIQTHVSRIEE